MASIIGVETLQHTNGTSAATIDSSGRILQPAKPAFHARKNASGTQGFQGVLVFDEEDFDVGGNYNTSNGRFTAPVAGTYYFCFDALVSTDSSGGALAANEYAIAEFVKNGATGTYGMRSYHRTASSTQYNTIHRIDCIQLSVNDYVQVNIPNEFIYGDDSGRYDPTFQGFLLG